MTEAQALIVDDDVNACRALAELVKMEGFATETAASLEEARGKLLEKPPDVVLCDVVLPDGKGTELLRELKDEGGVEVILVTGKATVDTAVEALRLEAYDYLTKPVDVARLKTLLAGVSRTLELKEEVSELRRELRKLGRFGPMVGTSGAMQRVYDLIDKVAPTDATVFLIGESGTGKELAAETVHRLSKRRKAAFLPLNCGAVSPTLIESELFGHEKGSFTGASRQHKGYFERADGGTLFLDEITEMPVELQVKLLRVLETGKLLRVGGSQLVEVDVRVVTATNRDPKKMVEERKLREDLFYRLKVFPMHLPPLRERDGDIELLTQHFLDDLNRREDAEKRLSPKALEALQRHRWPGNVRELKNVVQRAFILAEEEITPELLPPELGGEGEDVYSSGLELRVGESLDEAEKRLIFATLKKLDGDKKKAAKTLGISLKTLYNRLKRYQEEETEAEGP